MSDKTKNENVKLENDINFPEIDNLNNKNELRTMPESETLKISESEENEPKKESKFQKVKTKMNSKVFKIIFVIFLILIICVLSYVIYYLIKHRPNVNVDLLNETKEAYAKLENEHINLKNKCNMLEQTNSKLKNENSELASELNNSIMMYDEPNETEQEKPKSFKQRKAEIYKAYSENKKETKKKDKKKKKQIPQQKPDINEIITKNKTESEDEGEDENIDDIVGNALN